ncbi:MAG: polysialyltransferase family glycosyltransferase [Clostridiales bacterium]
MKNFQEEDALHILIYVLRRRQDYFYGVKKILSSKSGNEIVEIKLDKNYYDYIDLAEYSVPMIFKTFAEYKFVKRVIGYKRIFRAIEQEILKILGSVSKQKNIYIYVADEGVWGVFLMRMKRKLKCYNVKIVNIQHGFFILRKISYVPLRKIANKFFILFWGYPMMGMGFGGAHMDIYYVYGEEEKKFVLNTSPDSSVFAAPEICKYELLEEVNKKREQIDYISQYEPISKNILFAAQINEVNPDCKYTDDEITQRLVLLFKYLHDKGFRIFYRFHPALSDRSESLRRLKKYGVLDFVTILNEESLAAQLAVVSTVMSLQSTVLFDAFVAGCIPVVLDGFVKNSDLPFAHNKINMFGEWKEDLLKIVNI